LCGERLSICVRDGADRYGLCLTDPERTCRGRCLPAGAKNAAGRFTGLDSPYAYSAKGGSGMRRNMKSELPLPCRMCTQVIDPSVCENKDCRQWRQWFTKHWDRIHTYPRRQMEQTVPVGVSIGGRRYLHPDQMREYIQNDPCVNCCCTRDLCEKPCREKTIWEKAVKEANYELEK